MYPQNGIPVDTLSGSLTLKEKFSGNKTLQSVINAELSFVPSSKRAQLKLIICCGLLLSWAMAFANIIGSRVVFPENLPITCPLEFHPAVHAIVLISNLRAAQMLII